MTYTHWTPERDETLRRMDTAGTSRAKIAAEIGCSRQAVNRRAYRLGVTDSDYIRWTPDRDEVLRKMDAAGYSRAQIADRIGCSRAAINVRASMIGVAEKGLTWTQRVEWTAELDKKLSDLTRAGLSRTEVAAEIGCTRSAANQRANHLGLTLRHNARWTMQDQEQLRALIATGMRAWDIAGEMNRSTGAVNRQMRVQGLRLLPGNRPKPDEATVSAAKQTRAERKAQQAAEKFRTREDRVIRMTELVEKIERLKTWQRKAS